MWNQSHGFPLTFYVIKVTISKNIALLTSFGCNVSNTMKSVSSDIQTLRSGLNKRGAAEFFLTSFEVFGYLMKHSFECLIWLLKALIILGENQRKSSPNFMIIRITYPNLLNGSDFLCFLFMNY